MERLVAMGFDEGRVAQALAASEQDEMAAANMLMDGFTAQPGALSEDDHGSAAATGDARVAQGGLVAAAAVAAPVTPLRDAVRHAMNGYNNQTAVIAACPEGVSWCEALQREGSAHVAPATVFVSWALGQRMGALLDALEGWLAREGRVVSGGAGAVGAGGRKGGWELLRLW